MTNLSSTNVSGVLRLASLHITLDLFKDVMEIYDSIIRDEPNNGQILNVD